MFMTQKYYIYNKNVVKSTTIKILSYLLTCIMILSALSLTTTADDLDTQTIVEPIEFSTPFIQHKDNSNAVDISVEGAPLSLTTPRAPTLNRFNKRFNLPKGVTNVEVNVEITSPLETIHLPENSYISPAPIAIPLSLPPNENTLFSKLFSRFSSSTVQTDVSSQSLEPKDPTIYETDAFYPMETFEYNIYVGLNEQGTIGTSVVVNIFPTQYNPVSNIIQFFKSAEILLTYEFGQPLEPLDEDYVDLLIISANDYVNDLQPLVDHKQDMGLRTKLVSLDDVYDNVFDFDVLENPIDKQEQIKYFLYEAYNHWGIKYVMAVGGFRTFWGLDRPDMQFPIRFLHHDDGAEAGYASDQYYACFMKYHHQQGIIYDDGLYDFDPSPEVAFGRLACRNKKEVQTLVDKIITYETETYGSNWFNQMVTITGDGFQDIGMFTSNSAYWNIKDLPNGMYTIYTQSYLEDDPSVKGPIDSVQIFIDNTSESDVNFREHDNLLIEPLSPYQKSTYPGKPVAHIVVPSDNDTLGNTDVSYNPPEAYGSDDSFWAKINFVADNGHFYIKVKSYDPSPKDSISENYGQGSEHEFASRTYFNVWINNSDGKTIFWKNDTYSKLWYEGELECQKALDFMPETIDKIKLWSSNGQWTCMQDVIDKMSEGQGFVYFAGHGNPMSWGDHLPGIPGGRDDGMINGLKSINLDFGLARYESEEGDPFLPMNHIDNQNRYPVVLIGGCHNSMIDASFMRLFADPHEVLFTVLHGAWVPESFSWWLVKVPQGGAIATIGCSGLGYGYYGDSCLNGLGGWINPEFFRVYAKEDNDNILGIVYTQTLQNFGDGAAPNGYHEKTFKEWILLGDPSLKIGGYPYSTKSVEDLEDVDIEIRDIIADGSILKTNFTNNGSEEITILEWDIRVESDSPLGQYFGGTSFLLWLLRGRIIRDGHNNEVVMDFAADDVAEIESKPILGVGHFMVNVSLYIGEELITSKTEDGFVFLNRIIIHHPEE